LAVIASKQWVATTPRERELVREVNDRGQEIERLRMELFRTRARNKQLEEAVKRGPLVPAPPVKGEVLRPGAVGYITHVKMTAQGRIAFATDGEGPRKALTLCDMLILGVAAKYDDMTFDRIEAFIPKDIADRKTVRSYTNLLDQRGWLTLDYEKVVPNVN